MADASSKSEGRKGTRKHSGLGRGLGALIPQASEQTPHTAPSASSRPLDVFFPEGSSAGRRGGSAKDLLQPKRATVSSKKKRPADAVCRGGGWTTRWWLSQRPWRWNQRLRFPHERGAPCCREDSRQLPGNSCRHGCFT